MTSPESLESLRVLLLEDSAFDSDLIQGKLEASHHECRFTLVTSKAEFLATYRDTVFDLVLADFNLPGFNALAALTLFREYDPEVPFICVSGAIGEEQAVELLKAGATDFVSKSRLEKLPLAVSRALAEVTEKQAHRLADQKLRLSEERYQSLVRTSMDGFLVVDQAGRIQEVNQAICLMLGTTKSALLGMSWGDLALHPLVSDDVDLANEIADQGWSRYETTLNHSNGSELAAQVSAVQIKNQNIIVCFISDIGQRKAYERNMEKALREKETLIRELYHRTKNTIQVIRSLMELQALEHPTNKDFMDLVKLTNDRLLSINLVHQLLYHSHDLSRISLSEYLRELSALILRGFAYGPNRVSIDFSIDDRHVLIDTAVPFGLIVTELLTNSLKHAFPGGASGKISLSIQRTDTTEIALSYSDNGVGVPVGYDFRCQETLGLKLIHSLGEEQLAGKVQMVGQPSVSCSLVFPNNLYKARL